MESKRERENSPNEYIMLDSFKILFIIMAIVTFILLLLDRIYSDDLMEWSISVSVELQKYSLDSVAWFFGTTVQVVMYAYIAVVYTLRKNQETNFSLLFGALFLIYIGGISKLMLLGHRPYFLNESLNPDYCICDYGNPSSNAIVTLGTMLLVYTDITTQHKFGGAAKLGMKLTVVVIQLGVSFSNLYLGNHSVNQIMLGWAIGFTSFLGIRRMNDYMLKFIIWPIFYKDRFKDKRAIFHIVIHMMWMNYLLFSLWAARYTSFDVSDNTYFTFKNCKACLIHVGSNFSVEAASSALWINAYFGMLLGIYVSRRMQFNHKGLFAEGDITKYILRSMLLAATISPIVFAFIPVLYNVIITFARKLFLAVIIGMLTTSSYFDMLDYFGWTIESVPHQDESQFNGLGKLTSVSAVE